MGREKWIFIFLLVAKIKADASLGEQGEDSSLKNFVKNSPSAAIEQILDEIEMEIEIDKNPKPEEYLKLVDEDDFDDDFLVQKIFFYS